MTNKRKYSIMSYEGEKYVTTPEGVKDMVEKYGVAIVPDILNKQELESMRNGMWDYIEHITQSHPFPINRWNTKSWREFSKLYPKHSMLLQNWQIGQAQYIWDIRQNPKVVDVFSKIWDCEPEDLLSSFDGASVHFPPELTKKGWFRNLWYHTDQSYLNPDFNCIQSWVTAYDVNDGDATLSFMEGSNKFHKEFQKKFDIQDKSNWFKLNDIENHLQFYKDHGCEEKKIKCKKGSMVFWDSRTIHCGSEPLKNRKKMNMRNVVYICMMPRSKATSNVLKRRIKAFEEVRMSSHWPAKGFKLFPVNPRTYGGKIYETKDISKPNLSDLGKKLVGY
jgi:ectoine hydroxylase-related dioxygenase (phytanoyl-CoA dioxygenase family)